MRFSDIIWMALSGMRRQPGRTVMSLIGVVVGSFILLYSLAAQQGVEKAVLRVFSASDEMRRIEVWVDNQPSESEIPPETNDVVGKMSEEKRTRIRKALVEKWQREHARYDGGITRERLRELESIPHTVKVIPNIDQQCWAVLGTQEQRTSVMGVPAENDVLAGRITAGQMFASDGESGLLVHEFLAYLWGAASEDESEQLVGQTLTLEFRYRDEAVANTLALRNCTKMELPSEDIRALISALDRIGSIVDELPLPEDEKAALRKILASGKLGDPQPGAPRVVTVDYPIRGVFRGATAAEEQSGVQLRRFGDGAPLILPIGTATDLYYRLLDDDQYGLYNAAVIVDHENNLKQVSERLRQLGYEEYSLIRLVEHIQQYVDIITGAFAAVAGVALFVAAIGIANTMIMSVVERTHEIGIMKSIGARDRHVLWVFLLEGALVGILGAVAAIAISLSMSYVIDYAIRWIVEQQFGRSFDDERLLSFSWWMYAAIVVFSSMVTMLAAIVPARQAARIVPVAALRHQ